MTTRIFIDWHLASTKLEVIKSILLQAEAPEWHGLSLDAIEDSFVVGNVNQTNPPYEFILNNLKSDDEDLVNFQNSLIEIFTECVRRYAGSSLVIK